MPAVSKAQGGRVFQNCNVPLLVVVNTLLLVYIALHISSAVVSNHGSMMMVASPSPATPKECT